MKQGENKLLACALIRSPAAAEEKVRRRWWRHWAWTIPMILMVAVGAYLAWQQQTEKRQRTTDYQTLTESWPSGENVPAPWLDEAQIREAVETHAPPGSVPAEEYVEPPFTAEAEALVKGILALASAR